MKATIAKAIAIIAACSSFGAGLDPATVTASAPSVGSIVPLVQQGGLVAALIIAVWYLAKQSESKDKALYGAMTTVLKANTEALVAQKEQSLAISRLMVEVKERLDGKA